MKIGTVDLNITPSPANYQMTPRIFGTFERSLSHELVAKNITVKRTWRLEFYALEQVDALVTEASSGSNLTFVDYDEATYTVLITEFGPCQGYPREDLGKIYIVLEEV